LLVASLNGSPSFSDIWVQPIHRKKINMNRASIIAASLLLLWTLVPAAMAHTITSPHPGGGGSAGQSSAQVSPLDELHKLTALLNLTSEQQTKVDKCLKKQDAQVKVIQDKTTLTPAEKQTEITSVRTTTMTDIKGVLTPAQLAILKKSSIGPDGSGDPGNESGDTGSGGGNGAPTGSGAGGDGNSNP
jgi:hypothetical protein